MRIVGGDFKGKKLAIPTDQRVRPTSDRSREAIFNILTHGKAYRTENGAMPIEATVLDAFAGTGALGLEALSRGASHVTFMDNHAESLRLIKENVATLEAQRQCTILNRSAVHPGAAAAPVDLVLMDPPYKENLGQPCLDALVEGGWIGSDTVVVTEIPAKPKGFLFSGFEEIDRRKYGAAQILFLKLAA